MNIIFRKIEIEDLSFLNETRNAYAADYLHDSRTFTLQETINWYKQTNPDYWIIFDTDLNERIGYFRLSNYSSTNKNIYIGADISPKFTKKGYATKAYKKFIPFLFKTYNLHKISLEVLETNSVAIHLYEKLGFVCEGTKRQEVYKDGKWVNSLMMSVLNPKNKSISIAISFYFGKRTVFHNEINTDPIFYLKKNIEYINKLNTNIEKIYLICTFGYGINKDEILEKMNGTISNDKRFILKSKTNFGGSYSSWHCALEMDNGFSDYIVLMEDDYVLYDKNSIEYMLEYYENESDMIYLCTKVERTHAAISNGIINNRLYHYLKKHKNLDFCLEDFIEGIHNHYEVLWKNQTFFLKAYQEAGFKVKDFSDKYSAYFINTRTEFGVENGKIIFAPISEQFL